MNDDTDQQHPAQANPGYASGQLAAALRTALTHDDPDTRHRAAQRQHAWRSVLAGMANGLLAIGSRTPVKGLPAWVTPEVLRGGFATGEPSAGGPLTAYETEAARRAGVPQDRRALFAHWLSEAGLAQLYDLLDSGRYEVTVPEEAALLTVAWLARAGETDAALALVEELAPFAGRLRFAPRPTTHPAPDADAVHRRTVAEAGDTLVRRRVNQAVETQREALAVWQPFGDELLAHWLKTADQTIDEAPDKTGGGELPERSALVWTRVPDPAWHERSAELLLRYRDLARRHTLCTKHRKPKENLAILRGALEETVAGRELDARRLGLLRHAVASMVRRRGLPGSAELQALRREQAAQAALPSHHALAQLVLGRLTGLEQDTGVAEIAPLLAPVSEDEALVTGLPVGAAVPAGVRRPVEAALSAPLGTLVERGVVPSAEVLAELVPQLVAVTTAQAYPDPALRTLAAAHHRAFAGRRSLLLLNLQRQVRAEELPWVRAVAGQRITGAAGEAGEAGEVSALALRHLGELAVQAFPGTLLPNPLIRELSVLARQAELGAPMVEELAADIFMGTFTPKFLVAARIAAELLGGGSLYERYYGIDYRAVRNLAIVETGEALARSYGARTSPGFAKLCAERAGTAASRWGHGYGSPAANGTVIEQAQILTTHNLATLVHRVGIAPAAGWAELARRCFVTVCRLTTRLHANPRPLSTIKDVAYAWRHLLFHLSLCTPAERARTLAWLPEELTRHPAHVAARLIPALTGLHQVADGGRPDEGTGRLLTGWTTDDHWLRAEPAAATA
ncbi:hypothetical protein SAMN04487983_104043 [Streptomyces sp. yr375]|uniref:hypothetical protein n=1 Tax=Streptomyces sp. yr375 TaxID=1761906 RepID=UPI0008B51A34|nr:hypothetical protein [Streptomyces sp. yr375]SES28616.1 hypothetical protein SAMN04487983_104043 [Streptomyces sp. yr375]